MQYTLDGLERKDLVIGGVYEFELEDGSGILTTEDDATLMLEGEDIDIATIEDYIGIYLVDDDGADIAQYIIPVTKDGDRGNGIASQVVRYGVSQSSTEHPKGGTWKDTIAELTLNEGDYLWTWIETIYTDPEMKPDNYYTCSKQGEKGQAIYKSTVFRRSVVKPPMIPNSLTSFDNPVPENWSDSIPEGTDPIWSATRIFTSDGKAPQGDWSDRVLMVDTPDFEYMFCPNETYEELSQLEKDGVDLDADWEANANAIGWYDDTIDTEGNHFDAIWQAIAKRQNGVWGAWTYTKIKGEKGEKGDSPYILELTNQLMTFNVDGETKKVLEGKTINSKVRLVQGEKELDKSEYTIEVDVIGGGESDAISAKGRIDVSSWYVQVSADKDYTSSATSVSVVAKIEDKVVATASIALAFPQRGIVGPMGQNGPMPIPCGYYDESIPYDLLRNRYGDVVGRPVVYVQLPKGGEYYILEKDAPAGQINNDEYWTRFQQYENLFVKVLMANFAQLANFVFKGRYMFSENGVTPNGEYGKYSDHIEDMFNGEEFSGKWIPTTYIDAVGGAMACGKFTEQYDYYSEDEKTMIYTILEDGEGIGEIRITYDSVNTELVCAPFSIVRWDNGTAVTLHSFGEMRATLSNNWTDLDDNIIWDELADENSLHSLDFEGEGNKVSFTIRKKDDHYYINGIYIGNGGTYDYSYENLDVTFIPNGNDASISTSDKMSIEKVSTNCYYNISLNNSHNVYVRATDYTINDPRIHGCKFDVGSGKTITKVVTDPRIVCLPKYTAAEDKLWYDGIHVTITSEYAREYGDSGAASFDWIQPVIVFPEDSYTNVTRYGIDEDDTCKFYGDEDKSYFVWNGLLVSAIIVAPGTSLKLRSAHIIQQGNLTVKDKYIRVWYVDNSSDFEVTDLDINVRLSGSVTTPYKYMFNYHLHPTGWRDWGNIVIGNLIYPRGTDSYGRPLNVSVYNDYGNVYTSNKDRCLTVNMDIEYTSLDSTGRVMEGEITKLTPIGKV